MNKRTKTKKERERKKERKKERKCKQTNEIKKYNRKDDKFKFKSNLNVWVN
jgi:hypothetical protein